MLRRTLLASPLALRAQPRHQPALVVLREEGNLFTHHYGTGYPKPFLYPILAPDGQELSRGYPVNARPDDTKDHEWHRGIWWGHGDINGHDFWREKKDASGNPTTGTIRVDEVTGNQVTGAQVTSPGLTIHQTLLSAAKAPVAKLTSVYGIKSKPNAILITATLTLTSPTELRFGDTDDGGFAIRLREEFREDRGATLTNSNGAKGAKAIWGKPAPWTDFSTQIQDKTYGVAILSHPANLRHPSGWHARNYGLNSANPFAASSFAEEKGGQRGAFTLPANQPLKLRYAVVIHLGDAKTANIDKHFEECAKS
jgi:Methane oxygenase PmoA